MSILTFDTACVHLWILEHLYPSLRQGFFPTYCLQILTYNAGGYFGDLVYRRWGVPGKKYLMVSLGVTQGLLSLGLGMYIDGHPHPSCKQTLLVPA